MNFSVKKKIFLTSKHKLLGLLGRNYLANFFAEYGIFLITKKEFTATGCEEFSFKKNPINFRQEAGAAALSTNLNGK